MFAKVLAVLSVGSVLFFLPRQPAQPIPQDGTGGFTLSRVVLQNCEVDIRPKPRPMTVMADYDEGLNEGAKTYTVNFDLSVPQSDKVYMSGNVVDEANAVKLLTGATNRVTLTWDYSVSPPTLTLVFTNGTITKPPMTQTYEGEFDKLKMLSVSAHEVRRMNANPDKRRIRVVVNGCGMKTAFTLSDV